MSVLQAQLLGCDGILGVPESIATLVKAFVVVKNMHAVIQVCHIVQTHASRMGAGAVVENFEISGMLNPGQCNIDGGISHLILGVVAMRKSKNHTGNGASLGFVDGHGKGELKGECVLGLGPSMTTEGVDRVGVCLCLAFHCGKGDHNFIRVDAHSL